MRILRETGKFIFALAFIGLGIFNIVQGGNAAKFVPYFMPVPTLWVFVTGVAYILAAISIIINVQSRLACILLGLLVFLIAFSVHGLRLIHGQNVTANAIGFLEALAIGAGAWMAGMHLTSPKRAATTTRKTPDSTSDSSGIASENRENQV
jgi:uncharacterized membrane protein YphA (DoxX/SURF4 family)